MAEADFRDDQALIDADHRLVVAIDGPAAAGKTTVAQRLSDRLGAVLFDTGVLYRTVTLAALGDGIDLRDEVGLAELAHSRHIDVWPPSVADGRLYDVLLDGQDVTWDIRDRKVDAAVSTVSAFPAVRQALMRVQRRIAASRGPIVMVGRDIGTTVVPNAGSKIFLNASPEERARRRLRELQHRGLSADLDHLTADLRRRDELDRNRPTSPLRPADDAVLVDTDGLTIEEVSSAVEELVRTNWARLGVAPVAVAEARNGS